MEKKIGLLFPGQGSQKIGMGKDLYEKEASARWVFDRANEILEIDIKKICFEGPEEEITTTKNSQPAIFTASIAALNVLVEKMKGSPVGEDGGDIFSNEDIASFFGICMGLSLGELTALTVSGAISFEDGLRLVEKRGFFMDEASKLNSGKMASILGLGIDKVEEICKGVGCRIANLNSPGQVVISGHASKVELAAELAKNAGAKRAIMLKVSGAFHSDLMKPAKEKLKEVLSEINVNVPAIDFISNINADITKEPDAIKENLADQLDSKTLWERSIIKAVGLGYKDFYEVGPGTVLKGIAKKIDPSINVASICTLDDISALEF